MNDVHCQELEELLGVSVEVKIKWRDRRIYATSEPAGMCPVMSEKRRCSLKTWIVKQLAVGVTNPAPQCLDLGQMLTCWRME